MLTRHISATFSSPFIETFFKLFPSTIVGGHKLEFYLQPIISRIPRRSAFALSIVDFLLFLKLYVIQL